MEGERGTRWKAETYTELCIASKLSAPCVFQDVSCEVVEIVSLVGVGETLTKSIYEDTWVWNLDFNLRIGSAILLDREVCLSDNPTRRSSIVGGECLLLG